MTKIRMIYRRNSKPAGGQITSNDTRRTTCKIVKGWRFPATPPYHSTASGGDGCRRQSWYSAGTGLATRPQERPPAGATDASGCPFLVEPRQSCAGSVNLIRASSRVAQRQRDKPRAVARLHTE